MQQKNIVLIGAGSVVFTSSLLADFIADGGERELRLVDTNRDALEVASGLARRMVEAKSAPITVRASTDRREFLSGADVVITVLAVGGRKAWEADIQIPRKHGIYMPVADTTTPGGIARSMRILPVMVDIANDIRELCPGALFLNYANPEAAIVRAIARAHGPTVYGLCDGPPHVRKTMAKFLQVDAERCDFKAVGFNHFVWLLEFTVDGKDAYPAIKEKNEQLKKMGKPAGDDPDHPLAWELLDLVGYFPLSRDRHITEFFPQFFARGRGTHYGRTLGVDRFDIEPYIQGADREFEQLRAMADATVPVPDSMFHAKVGEKGTAQLTLGILGALAQSRPRRFHVTVPNAGQITSLKKDLAVECPVDFCRKKVEPVRLGDLPTSVNAFIEHAFVTTELIVEAALERDRRKFIQAIVLDGCVTSTRDAAQLADELIAAHREYLPGW